ncbi:Serine/arginine repetitive matrix protein 1 [Chamberlinius hualienensis]
MTDAGFFRGTSAEQDNRFSDKQKKLLKQMRFCDVLQKKVDLTKINLDTIKPWITKKIFELLGFEDEVIVDFVFNQLEEKNVDPRLMQINLTGFLNGKNAREFMGLLWELLLSAQENTEGIPAEFVEQKKEEIKKKQEEQERLQETLRKQQEKSWELTKIKDEPRSKDSDRGRRDK